MPLRDWFRPPRHLLTVLLLLTAASVSAVVWLGWTITQQESAVEAQRNRDRLEQAADRIVALLRASLAETGESLAAAAASSHTPQTPAQSVLLLLGRRAFRLSVRASAVHACRRPRSRGARPRVRRRRSGRDRPPAAGRGSGTLPSREPVARPRAEAGALMRLARVKRKQGQLDEARAAYRRLARLEGVRVAGAPADLVARHALCDLSREPADALRLQGDLLDGRWQLTRGQFEFYRAQAVRMSGRETPWARAGLTEVAGRRVGRVAARARDARPANGLVRREAVVHDLANGLGPSGRAHSVAGIPPEHASRRTRCGVRVDGFRRTPRRWNEATGKRRHAAGRREPAALVAVRGRQPGPDRCARQRLMVVGVATMVVFLLAGTYFIARAIRREVAVSRLQTDFVNAVSHEFRSPLTAMRQMSEILAFGRVSNEEKRQQFYDTLLGETRRLQRLVETLLNFNKLEAGARQYRLEAIDAGKVVEDVVAGFGPQVAASGRRIELTARPDSRSEPTPRRSPSRSAI